jgi:hypothetical protein
MSKKNRLPLAERVTRAAEASLADRDYVRPVDVFLRIGWLAASSAEAWQRGQIDCLESAVQSNPARISEALQLLRSWSTDKGMVARETPYVARTLQREALRFTASGDSEIEQLYRTHWVSPALSQKQRERLAEKTSRAPELVVVQPLNKTWKCHRCGETGGFLMMENPGPACLRCVGLGDLEFLPAGDALMTRRARAKSTRLAVVVRFSRTRGRYERQGLLVEPAALADVERGLEEHRRA